MSILIIKICLGIPKNLSQGIIFNSGGDDDVLVHCFVLFEV